MLANSWLTVADRWRDGPGARGGRLFEVRCILAAVPVLPFSHDDDDDDMAGTHVEAVCFVGPDLPHDLLQQVQVSGIRVRHSSDPVLTQSQGYETQQFSDSSQALSCSSIRAG